MPTRTREARTVYATKQLNKQWRAGNLPILWRKCYPALFDEQDCTLALGPQRRNHFCEWFVAVHLFHTENVLSLVEKYPFEKKHPHKFEILQHIFDARAKDLQFIMDMRGGKKTGVQPPDLLVYRPDFSLVRFVEVKGPGDKVHERQDANHARIERRLCVPVETIRVKINSAESPLESPAA
ncbi:MAG: VRR-NUC domain-containing protein [Deltaproteobacteria bacterium]|nr:VRR-NUC domain-containing protein [Deltaproteobacteria bacterium]